MEEQGRVILLFDMNFPILSISFRSFPRGRETRPKMRTLQVLSSHLLRKWLGQFMAVLPVLETRPRKAMILPAQLNSHLETLEAR